MTGGRHSDDAPIYCRWCGRDIVSCEGAFGVWMHADNRHECCDGETCDNLPFDARPVFTAEPETAADMDRRRLDAIARRR